jgi:hypothetical protein
MEDDDKEYEVGRGKPPVATRFKKGKSGNPSGKRKEVPEKVDPGKILQSIDNETIVVKIDGKSKTMRKGELYFQQLFTRAIKANLHCLKPQLQSAGFGESAVISDRWAHLA